MNVNLGTPYEIIIRKLIERGFGGNQTEIIRQALINYNRDLEFEEYELVKTKVETDVKSYKGGKIKGKSLEEIKKKFNV